MICASALAVSVTAFAQTLHLPPADLDANRQLTEDFTAYQPHYKEMRAERVAETRALAAKVFAMEAARQPTACSHQILFELESLLISSADFGFIDERLRDLRGGLTSPEQQRMALKQDPKDGSWGACYKEWFLKVYASYDQIEKDAVEGGPKQSLPRFLERVNTPQKLTAYLTSISVSDVRKNGVDRERELNEMLAILTRVLVYGRPGNYAVDPELKATMLDLLLHRLRNPETGWWGERYVREGREDFVDDLSITFHEVSYLGDAVPDMKKVIDTALAVKDMSYPVGWLWQGQYWNHNNMDVVTLFKRTWSSADDAQRREMTTEIEKMLNWCLHDSLQPDGSFKVLLPDGSVEDAEYYGTEFLARTGFFDSSKRFWTSREFPEAADVRCRIRAFIGKHRETGGAGGDSYKGAFQDLGPGDQSDESCAAAR